MAMLGLTKLPKAVVLVGVMGVGKTSVGRRLAKRLSVNFRDSDHEVEQAAGCTVADIYKWYGEKAFKDAEQKVLARLLNEPPCIISTGVETFVNPINRDLIKKQAFSIWLSASLETIMPRVSRRSHRPQLDMGEKETILKKYIQDYYPLYEQADFKIDCDQRVPEQTVEVILEELHRRFWSQG
jgi:shikimate kinase